MLASLDLKTQENYGAGLLRFAQYCDTHGIAEEKRCPASELLLSAFIASWAGRISHSAVTGWLAGLHFWHSYQGLPWHGSNMLRITSGGVKKLVPSSSKQKKRPPVSLAHMHALVLQLNASEGRDAAILAAACVGFWGVCRLGELVPPSEKTFDPDIHVSNDVPIRFGITDNGVEHAHFHIPKTKTDSAGADIHLTAIDDPSSPITFLRNHCLVNASVTRGAPLFAFVVADSWATLTKEILLDRCNQAWSHAGLAPLPGHAFRIGGSTELLLRGIHPDVVMIQGRWKSKAFLEYWRRIDEVIPLFISNSFADARVAAVHKTMATYFQSIVT